MKSLALLTTLALLALAAPADASDAEAPAMDCGWCCFLGPIDYAQCMGTMVYENNAPGGAAGDVTDAYWDATMHTVDVVQDNLPATTASVAYGCDGRTLQDDAACFAHGADDPLLYCYGTAVGVVECIAKGELDNWRTFNQRFCDHHLCLHFP